MQAFIRYVLDNSVEFMLCISIFCLLYILARHFLINWPLALLLAISPLASAWAYQSALRLGVL